MLGIEDQYIPASWNEADSQAKQVLDPILAPTPEGIKLADILLSLGMNLDLTLLSRPILGALTRFMLGDEIANWLNIPTEPVWTPATRNRLGALRHRPRRRTRPRRTRRSLLALRRIPPPIRPVLHVRTTHAHQHQHPRHQQPQLPLTRVAFW